MGRRGRPEVSRAKAAVSSENEGTAFARAGGSFGPYQPRSASAILAQPMRDVGVTKAYGRGFGA